MHKGCFASKKEAERKKTVRNKGITNGGDNLYSKKWICGWARLKGKIRKEKWLNIERKEPKQLF